MTMLPYRLQPYYGDVPDAGNALIEWDKTVEGHNYIDNTGHPVIRNGAGGEWIGSGNPEWPFQWRPSDWNDPANSIYYAGTMFSKGGAVDHWVPNATCAQAVDAQRAHPASIVAASAPVEPAIPVLAPVVQPTVSTGPAPGFIAALRAFLAEWHIKL